MLHVAVATTRWGGRRALALAICASLAALVLLAPSAQAATVQATCPTFGTTLAAAQNGDTIVLTGMCTNANTDIYDGTFTLPSKSGLTIEGAATGTNGFDGTAIVTGAALSSPVAGTDGLTLNNLTFHNYDSTLGAVRLTSASTASHPFAFTNDTFTGDGATTNVGGGGLSLTIHQSSCAFVGGPTVTISGSTFSGDTTKGQAFGGGGGAFVDLECTAGTPAATVSGNTFAHDSVTATGTNPENGGGLFVGVGFFGTAVPISLTQAGNVFDSNSISGTGSTYRGGGEATIGANVMSTGDSFTNNSLPGPSTATVSSEGGGFATLGGGNCTSPGGATSQATNLVAAGNSIAAQSGAGTAAHIEGAGVYVGCTPGGAGYGMTLNDSTIAGNSSPPGSVSGIDGETADTLVAHNSTITGNTGGSNLGGFGASDGANVTATFSDLCAVGSTTTAFTGLGNMCASPSLIDAGIGDVHETNASPTLDAGSNALVPAGVTTDAFGNPRVAAGRPGAGATVDIGAAENVLNPTVSDCSKLQTALSSAVSGDVITLAALCTVTNSGLAHDSFHLPVGLSSLTLQGASATDGFDGTSATSSALQGPSGGLLLKNFTVEHYALNGNAAVELSVSGSALPSIDGLTFSQNTNSVLNALGGALEIFDFNPTCPYTDTLSIARSTFRGNELIASGSSGVGPAGAGLSILLGCGAGHAASVSLTDNTFELNSIVTDGAGALGAGAYIANAGLGPLTASQSGNVFDGNFETVIGTPGSSYSGAGEWLASVNLTSNGDKFVDNTLPGPSGASATSGGGGLGMVRGTCGGPPTVDVNSVATNLVVSGNSIGEPSSGGQVEGAGIYAGCEPTTSSSGFSLTLVNSTVSENDGPGGVDGIDGEADDHLTLQNSIVTGNIGTGSSELGGFGIGAGAGSVGVQSSDVCAAGSTTAPFTGAGNICADPLLVSPGTGDMHETATSPTIDAGSNALVPAGVTTDFYGGKRIVGSKQVAARVDIGAAEDQTALTPIGTVKISGEKATASGVTLTVSCTGVSAQTCGGGVTVTTTEILSGKKVLAVTAAKHKRRHKRKTTVGHASYRLAVGHKAKLRVKLNRKGHALLARFGKLPVTVTVTQRNATGRSITISKHKLTVRPRHRKHGRH